MEGSFNGQYLYVLGAKGLRAFLKVDFSTQTLKKESALLLQEDIVLLEKRLQNDLSFNISLPEKIAKHTLQAGGKRLRPLLVMQSAKTIGGSNENQRFVKIGSSLELIHMATLIHDDVVDHASTRRGKPTASTLYGNTKSILTGDLLLAKAMRLLSEDGNLEILKAVSKMVLEMAEGQLYEIQTRGKFEISEEEHLKILRMKTASFMECCCFVGGLLGKANDEQLEKLKEYGHNLGMAFQLIDDLLDFRGNEEETGKSNATDFKEGCVTLPLIYLRSQMNDKEQKFLQSRLGNEVTENEICIIKNWMKEKNVFDQSKDRAHDYVYQAEQALKHFAPSSSLNILHYLLKNIIERES